MRHARSLAIASAAALLAAVAGAQTARPAGAPKAGAPKAGTEVASIEFKLVASNAAKTLGTLTPREIPLNAVKPTSIRKVPEGTTGARFATIPFGTTEDNRPMRYAVLVTADSIRIDANANNDLSDDQPIPTQTVTVDSKTRRAGVFKLPLHATGPVVDVDFAAPDLTGSSKSDPMTLTPNYALAGTVKLGDESYPVLLVDGACDGAFAASKNPKTQGALLVIDRNVNGRNDGLGEAFPVGQPFNIAGVSYELRDVNAKMNAARVVISQRHVNEVNPPSDLRPGSQALSFETKDVADKTMHFPTDFKGQVVLLDFWATWCGPCMAELPNVVEAYKEYHSKGFEIVGISLDKDPAAVRAFSRLRKITWPMVCDGKEWNAEVAKLYRVRGIPAMWLVDGDTGKILATSDSLRGEGALARAIEAALVVKEQERMKSGGSGETPATPTTPTTPATPGTPAAGDASQPK